MNVNVTEPDPNTSAARSMSVALLPVLLAVIGPAVAIISGALKPILLFMGVIYLSLFSLTYVPTVGTVLQSTFRSFGDAVTSAVPLHVGEDLLRVVGLDGVECRARTICEITEEAVQKYPTVGAMLRSLSGSVQAQEGSQFVVKGLLGGLSGLGCRSLYSECAQSPFEKFVRALS